MNTIYVEFEKESLLAKDSLPVSKMDYDTIVWCFAVVFRFLSNTLVIEAPLFAFVKKVYDALAIALRTNKPVLLNDEYGSFQITLTVENSCIILRDAFGGGGAKMDLADFVTDLSTAFRGVVVVLEKQLPDLLENGAYLEVKAEITDAERRSANIRR